jgi:hypothetical protein
MKNIKKISNFSVAGLIAVSVMLLGLFAYRQQIQADTIVPGYATAHLNIHVMVPGIQDIPFKATFLPLSNNPQGLFYFKERPFTMAGAGLNTIEWYIRKLPAGTYKVVLESNGKELTGSPYEVVLTSDKVNDTTSFELFIGEPIPSPVPETKQDQAALPDPNYDEQESVVPTESVTNQETLPDEEYEATDSQTTSDSPPVPGDVTDSEGPF